MFGFSPEMASLAAIGSFLVQFVVLILKLNSVANQIHDRISSVEQEALLEVQKIKQSIIEARLEAANTYLRKDTFNSSMTNIDSRLIRMEGKLDSVLHRSKE